jgi:t-SNARE complex subunit (syntaxin)
MENGQQALFARLARLESRVAIENARYREQAKGVRTRLLPLIRRYRATWEGASTSTERQEIEDAYLQACRRRAQADTLLGLLEALRK